MTQKHDFTRQTNQISLGKRMLTGAGIAFALIAIFLSGVNDPDPQWPKFWYLRPLIIVPLAGAAGGACSYYIMRFRHHVGVNKVIAICLSLIVFIVGLWLGTVLGLDGTLWN